MKKKVKNIKRNNGKNSMKQSVQDPKMMLNGELKMRSETTTGLIGPEYFAIRNAMNRKDPKSLIID